MMIYSYNKFEKLIPYRIFLRVRKKLLVFRDQDLGKTCFCVCQILWLLLEKALFGCCDGLTLAGCHVPTKLLCAGIFAEKSEV